MIYTLTPWAPREPPSASSAARCQAGLLGQLSCPRAPGCPWDMEPWSSHGLVTWTRVLAASTGKVVIFSFSACGAREVGLGLGLSPWLG